MNELYGQESLLGGAAGVSDWAANHRKLQALNDAFAKFWGTVKAEQDAGLDPGFFKRSSDLLVRWDKYFRPMNRKTSAWSEQEQDTLGLYEDELKAFQSVLDKHLAKPAVAVIPAESRRKPQAKKGIGATAWVIYGAVVVLGVGAVMASKRKRR